MLMGRGHWVAQPLSRDDPIDLIVDHRTTVQVKCSGAPIKDAPLYRFTIGHHSASPGPPKNLFGDIFLFHGRAHDAWWVVPGEVVRRRVRGRFVNLSISDKPYRTHYSELLEYRDAWSLFGDTPAVRTAI